MMSLETWKQFCQVQVSKWKNSGVLDITRPLQPTPHLCLSEEALLLTLHSKTLWPNCQWSKLDCGYCSHHFRHWKKNVWKEKDNMLGWAAVILIRFLNCKLRPQALWECKAKSVKVIFNFGCAYFQSLQFNATQSPLWLTCWVEAAMAKYRYGR